MPNDDVAEKPSPSERLLEHLRGQLGLPAAWAGVKIGDVGSDDRGSDVSEAARR